MNPISQGIALGYSGSQLLSFLSNMIPSLAPKIQSARKQGHSIERILSFIGKTMEAETLPSNMTQQQIHAYNTKKQEGLTKGILKTIPSLGLTALGASALSRALPQSMQALSPQISQGLLGNNNTSPLPQGQPTPQAQPSANITSTVQTQPSPSSSQNPPVSPILTQNPASNQSQGISLQSTSQITPLPQALHKKTDALLEQGNDIDAIAGVLKKFYPQIVKDYEKATNTPIRSAIEEFSKTLSGKTQTSPMGTQSFNEGKLSESIPLIENAKEKIPTPQEQESIQPVSKELDVSKEKAKGKTVVLPNGDIGEIMNIRQGIATVNANGKEYRRKVEDLEEEPEDVIETVQNLLKIPEIDKSSIVSLFTYDPEEKKMYIQFHTGDTYKYLDVDPEKVMKIANKMGIPVTEGKNIFGAWSPKDKKSLGATLIQEIINDPKYKKAKKGEEPNPNYTQLETLYDYWQDLRKKPKRKGL